MELHPMLLRFKARKALKGHWQTALVAAFAAGLFNTLYQVAVKVKVDMNALRDQAVDFLTYGQPIRFDLSQLVLPGIFYVLALLLTPPLQLGLRQFYLMRLRGEEAPFAVIFSRMGIFFKALGLDVLIQLRILLWSLLGLSPLLLMLFMPNLSPNLVLALLWPSVIASVVLMFMAVYRYVLAPFAMAEEPSLSVIQAIRLSKGWMKDHKAAFLMVQLGFFGWMMLRTLIPFALYQQLNPVLTTMIELFADLALSVYMMTAYAAFYQARVQTPPKTEENTFEAYIENDREDK